MNYILMRKNDPIAAVQFSEDGSLISSSETVYNEELAPLQFKTDRFWLQKWWQNRSVPLEQARIEEMLREKNLLGPEDYLLKNLGLSLTDYYWIRPADSTLSWEDVNLFDNDFKDNLLAENFEEECHLFKYTPNSSLQGQLEKTWSINENGERILIKGNSGNLSAESLNEIIASEIHKRQGYDNFVPYRLTHIQNRDYDYGCYSKLFTSQKLEMVSAHAVITSEPQSKGRNSYEQFIHICGKHGMDTDQLRQDLEYQIMTDFILSNPDRHLGNIAVLRDADTLQFLRMAPIYDSGKSLFAGRKIPADDRELFRMKISSFATRELKLLSYVRDSSTIDVSKLPNSDFIREIYLKDSQADRGRTERIVQMYGHKIDLFDRYQHGMNITPYYRAQKM